VPTNAIVATLTFTVILSLILIGSETAFNIIASVGASAILGSYIVSITTIAYRKMTGYKLPKTRFPLGRLGLPINILALCFLWLAFVLVSLVVIVTQRLQTPTDTMQVFFPSEPNPTASSMNWSCLIFGAVMVFAMVWFAVRQRSIYKGPVVQVRDEEDYGL
jgi:choline transport protein